MDLADRFHHRGDVLDDLLAAAFRVPQERFVEPGPDGAPSLRDLLVQMVDRPRAFVNDVLVGRPLPALRPESYPAVTAIGPLVGGFRLTLRDQVEGLGPDDLDRPVVHDGTEAPMQEHLVRLLTADVESARRVAARLEALGVEPPDVETPETA